MSKCYECLETCTESCAGPAITVGICCLTVAAMLTNMELVPMLLAVVAALLILTTNTLLILFSTRRQSPNEMVVQTVQYSILSTVEDDASDLDADGAEKHVHKLEPKTCAQAYSMLPVSAMALLCMALYKAESDAYAIRAGGDPTATRNIPSVAFLHFMGCKGVLKHTKDKKGEARLAVHLHTEFMQSVFFAVGALLLLLAVRSILAKCLPADEDVGALCGVGCFLRGCHILAVCILLFALVGFEPLWLSAAACLVSAPASLGLYVVSCNSPLKKKVWSQIRQFYAFFLAVTFPGVYGLGCLWLETVVVRTPGLEEEVHLHYLGFEMAMGATIWYAITRLLMELCRFPER